MKTIDREELRAKLERGDEFKLVMTMSDWAFNAKHIPGSINVYTEAVGLELLDTDDEIVVYCSYEDCIASRMAYEILRKHGYTNVRRYTGGIADWEEAGYPLAGRRGNLVDVVESSA
jgi:rhodanese-related sulfurtransferase